MATHHDKKNQLAASDKNTPGLPEVHKADALPNLERDDETQQRLEDEAEDAGTRHPNRGYNKPDNGKGSY